MGRMDQKQDAALLALQSGVVSRRQLHDAGLEPHDLKRLLRQRDLVRLHDGVFVNHTGAPTWLQRAWAGVLLAWPAALSHDSAIRAADGPGRSGRDDRTIHLAVDRRRSLAVPAGYRLHRLARLDDKVQWNTTPPRVRIEEALIDVAAEKSDDFDAIAALADAISARRTTAGRICRAPRRSRASSLAATFLHDVLRDLDVGTCSVLEHGYLTRIEGPHGLPDRRAAGAGLEQRSVYRDVVYDALRAGRRARRADVARQRRGSRRRPRPRPRRGGRAGWARSGWGGARSSAGRARPPYASGAC